MKENEYRPLHADDEDLSPTFTRARRSVPTHSEERQARKTEPTSLPPAVVCPKQPIRKNNPQKAPEERAQRINPAEKPREDSKGLQGPTEENSSGRVGLSLRAKRILRLAVTGALAVVATFVLVNVLFSVREISVVMSDDALGWTEQEILKTAGIAIGDPMRRIKEKEISDRISDAFPALAGAEVAKSFPGKVVILPRSATPSYRFDYEEKTYILSRELKVLAPDDGDHTHLPVLSAPEISACVLGNRLAFSEERDYNFAYETAAEITDRMVGISLDRIDISNKVSISVYCEGKYKLLFGDKNNIRQKAQLATEALRDPVFGDGREAEIDVSTGNKASVKFTNIGN